MPFADRYTEDATLTIGRETYPVLVQFTETFDLARGRSTELTANESRRVPVQMEEGRRVFGGRLWINGVSSFLGWRIEALGEPVGTLSLADGHNFDVWLQNHRGYNHTFIAEFVEARHLHREVKINED